MKQFASSDAVSVANLNSVSMYDAVVIAGATPSGSIYATVDAAIDAGCKSIFVTAGEYAGFTADVTGLYIVGASLGIWNGSAFTGGVRFTSTITISQSSTTLQNISVTTSSGAGFSMSGASFVRLINCQAVDCATYGLATAGTSSIVVSGGSYSQNTSHGMYLFGTSTEIISVVENACIRSNGGAGVYFGATADMQAIRACSIYGNTSDGVEILSGALDIYVESCIIRNNSAWGIDNAGGDTQIVLLGNIVLGNTTGQINAGTSTAANNVTT